MTSLTGRAGFGVSDVLARGLALVAAAGLLAGCSGFGQALGLSKSQPDEFAIVTQAPLILPPDFQLKPPKPGARGPAQSDAEIIAERALVGSADAATEGMSAGERTLVDSAGAAYADPLIREVVDREYADIARKSEAVSNRLLFGGSVPQAEKPINARAEADRLAKESTGAADGTDQGLDAPAGQERPTIKKDGTRAFEGLF